jgi:two-component system, NtrC family, sensor kinase
MARLGLRGRLAVVLGAIILLAFALVYLATSSLASSILMEQELRAISGKAGTVAVILLGLAHDPQELDRALASASQRADLETLQVLNEKLEMVAPRQGTPAEILLGRERLERLLERDAGTALVRSPGRGELFATLRPLPGGGYLFAARSAEDFFQRKRSIVNLLVIWGAVVLLAILLMGAVVVRNLVVRPIDRLVEEAGEIATGHRDVATSPLTSDEFGSLQHSLSAMARRIQDDRHRIETQVEELSEVNMRLVDAHDQLIRTEKLASVGQLAAGVAHEIGNPIGVIIGYLEMLEDESADEAFRMDANQQIRTATERIQGTIQDLLDFSRPAADEEAASNLAAETESIVRFVSPQKRFRNVDIDVATLDPDVPLSAMPPSRYKQVLLNLLFNAADAMGGEGRIAVRLASHDEGVQVTVRDTGRGISEKVMLRIFDPFYTTKEVGEGTGLGLFVSHTIMNRYNGRIEVSSPLDGGALFTLVMPAVD